jgi:hypothetical protein
MDIPIYVGLGLLASGYIFNKDGKQARQKPKVDVKHQNDLLENKKAGGHHIYDTGYFNKVREIEDEKVIANFEKSFDPINTNVIPFFFNTLNETQVKRVKNPRHDRNLFQKEMAKIMKTTPMILSQLEPTPNDLTTVNQDASIETGGWNGSPPNGLYAETELNKGWSTLVTRPVADTGVPLTHNNMVPYFGSSSKQNMDVDNRMMSDKLETFTGQFKLDQQHKIEATPLFAPVQQNLDQLIEPRELDRYTTSLQIRNNELPFEQIHVGHGLNDGYTARPSGGFHNPLRILPKTIDQLLVNPRTVKEGRVIRGKDKVDKRAAQQIQYKYRPELLVTNFNGERNFTTVGAKTKPTARAGVIQLPTNRQVSRKVIGHAKIQSGSQNTMANLLPKGKVASKPNFKNTPFRNAIKADGARHHNDQQLRYENRNNERSTTQVRYGEGGYLYSNCKIDVAKGQTYQQDKAKKTRNQSYIIASNPSGYVQVASQKGMVYDPNSVAKTTIRETNQDNNHTGYLQMGTVKGQAYDPFDVSKTTIRQTTEVNQHQGNVQNGGSAYKGFVYDPNNLPTTTIRQTTEQNQYLGQTQTNDRGKGPVYDPTMTTKTTIRQTTEQDGHLGSVGLNNQQKGQVYDPSCLAKTTIRQMTENDGHLGSVGQSGVNKGQAYDPNDTMKTTTKETTELNSYLGTNNQSQNNRSVVYDPNQVAKTTIRQTTELDDHLGGAGTSHMSKQIAYDPFDAPQTTHRETTENNDYLMPAESSALQNGKGYQTAPTDTKNTQRQDYSDTYHVGGAGQAEAPSNQQLYDSAYNMRQNPLKEVVAEGRMPTLSGMKVTQGKVGVNMEIKKMERDQVNQYSAMRAPIHCNQRKPMSPCELTSSRNALPPTNTYFDPTILKAYIGNPLTQSLQSWA